MGEIKGFIKYPRKNYDKEPAKLRKQHWEEFISCFLKKN